MESALTPPLSRREREFLTRRLRRRNYSAAPAGAVAAGVDVDEGAVGRGRGIDADTAYEIRMFLLDRVGGGGQDAGVLHIYPAVVVQIVHPPPVRVVWIDVCGVAVLMARDGRPPSGPDSFL